MSNDDPTGVFAAMRKAMDARYAAIEEQRKALDAEHRYRMAKLWLPAKPRIQAANRRLRIIILAVVAAIVLVAVTVATLGAP